MPIISTSTSKPRELTPPGNYIARCYQVIEIGHINLVIQGKNERLQKVRIGWELPTELKVFKEERGPEPRVTGNDYIYGMTKKAAFRAMLDSWRGVPMTDEDAKIFDLSNLINTYCLLNIIHGVSAKTGNPYETIKTITPVMKGMSLPAPINPNLILAWDSFDQAKFDSLPEFIRNEMKKSEEYNAMFGQPANGDFARMQALAAENAKNAKVLAGDDLPF